MNLEEIRQKKKQYGYTNLQMAEKSGLPLATVQKVLGGTTKAPRYQTIQALASVFPQETQYSTKPESAPNVVREPGAAYAAEARPKQRYPHQGSYTIDDYLALPDVCVVCDHSKINQVRIFGAPDFVVEVLSPSTKMKDILIKMKKYHSAGVREYWMVDPDAETVTKILYQPPTEELPDGDMKMEIYPFSTSVPVGIFNDECVIDFGEIRERYAFMFGE